MKTLDKTNIYEGISINPGRLIHAKNKKNLMNKFPGKYNRAKFKHIIFHDPFITMKKSEKSNKKVRHCVKCIQIRSFFWSVFYRIRTEYGEIRSISLYSVQMRENTDQKKFRIWTLLTQCEEKDMWVIFGLSLPRLILILG